VSYKPPPHMGDPNWVQLMVYNTDLNLTNPITELKPRLPSSAQLCTTLHKCFHEFRVPNYVRLRDRVR